MVGGMSTSRDTSPSTAAPTRRGIVWTAAAVLLLTACGAEPGSSGQAGHVDADVEFVQQMIPHHEQAVMMSEMAEQRADSQELVSLAERIEAAQAPEIEQMQAMLARWGEDGEGAAHGAHHGMAGMMDEDRMDALRDGSGTAFDQMWLESMIEHHEGAVEMSRTQLDEGEDPEALALAETIIEAQEAEIVEMEQMLSGS